MRKVHDIFKKTSVILTLVLTCTILISHPHSARAAGPSSDAVHDAAYGDKGHKAPDGLPQLNFETYPSQIFWMFIIFILMYLIFAKKNLPEISGTIEKRRTQIDDDLESASKLQDEGETVQNAYEEILAQARSDASSEFKDIENKIRRKTEKELNGFNARSQKAINEKESAVRNAQKAAMDDVQNIANEVATIAAEKILGEAANSDKKPVKKNTKKAA